MGDPSGGHATSDGFQLHDGADAIDEHRVGHHYAVDRKGLPQQITADEMRPHINPPNGMDAWQSRWLRLDINPSPRLGDAISS